MNTAKKRIVSADFGRVDIQLHDRSSGRWQLPVICHLTPGVTTNEKHQVRFGNGTVSAFPGVAATHESDIPVLVDFWAPWCGPCRLIAPIVEELAKEYDGKMAITKLNVDDAPQVTMNYRIRSIPTVMFIKDGKVADTVVGAVPKRELLKRVEAVLGWPHALAPRGSQGKPGSAPPADGLASHSGVSSKL